MFLTLLIALGGALGALGRYGLSNLSSGWLGESFPYGTLIANLVGCFAFGAVQQLGDATNLISQEVRLAIGIGFLGALTTYSTFGYETLRQLQLGRVDLAAANVCIHLVFGLIAVWSGMTLVRAF